MLIDKYSDLITFSSIAYPHLSLRDVIKKAKEMNIRSLEIRVSEDGIHINPDKDDPEKIKMFLNNEGVKIILLSSYVRARDPETIEGAREFTKMIRLIDLANKLSVNRVRVFAYYIGDIYKTSEEVKRFIEKTRDVLIERDIRILFETHDYFAKINNLIHLIKIVERYNDVAGILFDPANIILADEDYNDIINIMKMLKLKDHIYHIHIKNFVKTSDHDYIYVEPDKGVVDICRIIEDLREILARPVYISIEWEKLWRPELKDPDYIIPLYIRYLRGCLD